MDQDRRLIKGKSRLHIKNGIKLQFYNESKELVKEVNTFDSLQVHRRFTSFWYGELHTKNFDARYMKLGYTLVINNDSKRSGEIVYIEIDDLHVKEAVIKIQGFLWWYKDRHTEPQLGYDEDTYLNMTTEDIMCEMIKRHGISSTNPNRIFMDLVLDASRERGDVRSWSSRYKCVLDELQAICGLSNLGHEIYFNHRSKKYHYRVLCGEDRTVGNASGISPYVFSRRLNRVIERQYIKTNMDQKTTAYVAGQGEGAEREMIIVNDRYKGKHRKELFVDARDTGEEGETTLEDKGKAKLAEYPLIDTFKATVDSQDYRVKWDLGDFVTIKDDETGEQFDRQVLEVYEVYEPGRILVEPTFGEPLKKVLDIAKRQSSMPESTQGKQGNPGQDGKTPAFRLDGNGNLFAVYE